MRIRNPQQPALDSYRWPVATHELMQTGGDLAERAMPDGVDQLGENISPALDHDAQAVQCGFAIGAMAALELLQAVELQLLLRPRRAHDVHVCEFISAPVVAGQ